MSSERQILLVRHAKAGDRGGDQASDRDRRLSGPGLAQAEKLPALMREFAISSIHSSPYRRCIETVTPLARERGLEVQAAPELGECSGLVGIQSLLWSLESGAVLCSHGDVIGEAVGELIQLGLIPASEGRAEKGATWVLTLRGVHLRAARYLPPP